jgi:hypothetical protein
MEILLDVVSKELPANMQYFGADRNKTFACVRKVAFVITVEKYRIYLKNFQYQMGTTEEKIFFRTYLKLGMLFCHVQIPVKVYNSGEPIKARVLHQYKFYV